MSRPKVLIQRQSSGAALDPETIVVAEPLRYGLLADRIGEPPPPAGFEHASDPGQCDVKVLLREDIEQAVLRDEVDSAIGRWKRERIALEQFHES